MSERAPARPDPSAVAAPLVSHLRTLMEDGRSGAEVFIVALDGRSGAGKSTVAAAVVAAFGLDRAGAAIVSVIEGDEFYAGGSHSRWDRRSAAEKADRVIDWRRQHAVLAALKDLGSASWHGFDWASDDWDAENVPFVAEPTHLAATPIVILEGAYSARPELDELIDLRVLLDLPAEIRRQQLLEREGEAYRADWEARWSEAEVHYFTSVMPPERFDLILQPLAR